LRFAFRLLLCRLAFRVLAYPSPPPPSPTRSIGIRTLARFSSQSLERKWVMGKVLTPCQLACLRALFLCFWAIPFLLTAARTSNHGVHGVTRRHPPTYRAFRKSGLSRNSQFFLLLL